MGNHALKVYIAVLAVIATGVGVSCAYRLGMPFDAQFVVAALVAAVLLAAAESFPIRIGENYEVTALSVGLVATVALLGPVWAAAAVLPCAVVVGRGDLLRVAFEASRNALEVFAAGVVFSLASAPILSGATTDTASAVYATFASAVALSATNHLVNGGLLRVKHGQGFRQTWRDTVEPYLVADFVAVFTAGLGVLALLVYGPLAAVVVVAGSVASQALVYTAREHAQENRMLKEERRFLKAALEGAGESFGSIIIRSLGRKDGYTHLHAAATATYAHDLALELGMEEDHARRVRTAGLLHDVGLYGLPDELLYAGGQLNSVGRRQVEDHPARGQEALKGVSGYEDIADWIRWHHERFDGRGYPDRLKGQWIPLESKVLAVASAYANAVLDKPSVPGASYEDARKHLAEGIGVAFDERATRAFLRILDSAEPGYRMADDERFAFPTVGSAADTRRTG